MDRIFLVAEEGADEASARGGQLEVLDGEGEVVVGRVEDEEAVVDALLQALGLVAVGDERAGRGDGLGGALLDAGALVELVTVRLDFVDDDAPLAVDVDGAQWLDVGGSAGAQVRLLFDGGQRVDRVLGVDGDVLVEGQHGLVVLVEGVDDVVGRGLAVLQAPGLGGVLRAGRDLGLGLVLVGFVAVVRRLVVVRRRMVVRRFVVVRRLGVVRSSGQGADHSESHQQLQRASRWATLRIKE